MKRTNPITTALAVAILAIGVPSLAQAQDAPDPHHPAQGEEAPQGATTPQAPPQDDQSGMMGMMRMMNMMQMKMQMMNMMQMMDMMQMNMMGQKPTAPTAPAAMGQIGTAPPTMGVGAMDTAGTAVVDHVEGRIAFLRAELGITEAQTDLWNTFAATLRDNAKKLGEARMASHGTSSSASGLEQQLAAQEQWLSARLEGIKAIRAAFGPLYKSLSADQQKIANELLRTHMGMMSADMKPMGGTAP